MPKIIFARWQCALAFVLLLSCLPYANPRDPFGFLLAFAVVFAGTLAVFHAKRHVKITLPVYGSIGLLLLGSCLLAVLLLDQTRTFWATIALLAVAYWLALGDWVSLHALAVPVAWTLAIVLVGSLLLGLDATQPIPATLPRLSPYLVVHMLPLCLLPCTGERDTALFAGAVGGALVGFGLLLYTASLLGAQGLRAFAQPLPTMFAHLPLLGLLPRAGAVFTALLTVGTVMRWAVVVHWLREVGKVVLPQ